MKAIVTAGPGYEPIDEVRRLTNFSTGELGLMLAGELAAAGWEVICLRGEGATSGLNPRDVEIRPFSTNEDLLSQLTALSGGGEIAAIFHVAALCDFKFGKILNAQGVAPASAKIESRGGSLTLELEPAPKVIGELRRLFPAATIVGWKYELNGGRDEALGRAFKQVRENRTDACVLNGRAWGSGFAFCTLPESVEELAGKAEVAGFLPQWLQERQREAR